LSIAHQAEEAETSNQLRKNKVKRKREHDDEKKDRAKSMLEIAAAARALEVHLEFVEGCQNSSTPTQKEQLNKSWATNSICSRNSPAPLPWQIHQCKLKYTKQLHSFWFLHAAPSFESQTGQLSHLPLDPWNQHQTIAWQDQIIWFDLLQE
jgi:hypothetical protein